MNLTGTFSPQALGWLGEAFEDCSTVSPFSRLTADGFTEEEKNDLLEVGVVDNEDNITSAWSVALTCLARPHSFVRLRFQTDILGSERVMYFGDEELDSISLTFTQDEKIRVEYLPDNEGFLAEIAQHTGNSTLLNSNFDCRIGFHEALLLLAAVDLNRLQILRCIADEVQPSFVTFTEDALYNAAFIDGEQPVRLTKILRAIRNRPEDLPREELGECLQSLCDRELFVTAEEGYELGDAGKRLAGNFLIIDQVVQIDCGSAGDEDDLSFAQALFLQAGLHDILMIDPGGGSVALETVSAAVLGDYLQTWVTEAPR